MGFRWNRSSLSQDQQGTKTRVQSLLLPKQLVQGNSMSQHSYLSDDSDRDNFSPQDQQQKSTHNHNLPKYPSQRSYSSRSRGTTMDGPPSGNGDPREGQHRQHQHSLSFQGRTSAQSSQTMERMNKLQPVYNDSIPLGQPSDFSSQSSSSLPKRPSQSQHWDHNLPFSQSYRNSQSSNEYRKSSLLDSNRSKPFLVKKTHFADDRRPSEMHRQPPMEFLSQDSSTSRGPLRPMNLSQPMRYGLRSSQSTFNSTLSSSQSQAYSQGRNRSASPAQALLTRTTTAKVRALAAHTIAFASNATLQKSHVEKQMYPKIDQDENRKDMAPSQKLLQKEFVANLESIMERKKEEFDRHAQASEQKAIAAVESKMSAAVTQIRDTAQMAETQLREEQESIMTAFRCEKKSILERLKEEAANLSTMVESKATVGVYLIESTKAKAIEAVRGIAATLTEKTSKVLPIFAGSNLSMTTPPSKAIASTRGNRGLSTADGQDVDVSKNSVVTPGGPAAAAKRRATENEKKKRERSPIQTRARQRRKKKDKAEAVSVETPAMKAPSPPLKIIEFTAKQEADLPTPSECGAGNLSTQSMVVSPEPEPKLESEPNKSLPSKPLFESTTKNTPEKTPKPSQRMSTREPPEDLCVERKATEAVLSAREKRSKPSNVSKRAQENLRTKKHKTTVQELRKDKFGQEKKVSTKASSATTPKSAKTSLSSKRKDFTRSSVVLSSSKKSSLGSRKAATPKSATTKTSFGSGRQRRCRKHKIPIDGSIHSDAKRAKIISETAPQRKKDSATTEIKKKTQDALKSPAASNSSTSRKSARPGGTPKTGTSSSGFSPVGKLNYKNNPKHAYSGLKYSKMDDDIFEFRD